MADDGSTTINVLIVEDNPGDALLVHEHLDDVPFIRYSATIVDSLGDALAVVERETFDVVLLDLSLPDSYGTETVTTAREKLNWTPIIVLTGNEDQGLALEALREGAQDYLVKSEAQPAILDRTIRYAIERSRADRTQMERMNFEEALFSSVPSPLYVKDADGRYLACNEAFANMLGKPRAEIIGARPEEIPTNFLPVPRIEADKRLRTQGGVVTYETEYTSPLGEMRSVFVNKAAFVGAGGSIQGIIGVVTDVTEIKDTERRLRENEARLTEYIQQLEQSRRSLQDKTDRLAKLTEEYAVEKAKAQAADRAKGEFLATMSHEIRTPLTGILGMADLLLDMELNLGAKGYVETIRESGEILLGILNDILDMSRLEAGRLDLEVTAFDMHRLVQDLWSLMMPKAEAKDVAIKFDLLPEVPQAVSADPIRIRQILFNLLGNAIKFTSRGQIALRVSVQEKTGETVVLRFEIEDTGIGIPENVQSRLFQRFSQADPSTSRQYGGSGLGLAICRHLTEVMGGDIGFSSRVGEGSLFWFTVPCRIAAPAELAAAVGERAKGRFRAVRSLRILVAEDNRINQTLIATQLARLGHRVVLAGDGAEALDRVTSDEFGFDVVLMDVRMPKMDGQAATRAIRAIDGPRARVPIVAVTADAMEDHLEAFRKAGMDACVVKPIDLSRLVGAIDGVVGETIHKAEERIGEEGVAAEPLRTVPESHADPGADQELERFLEDLDLLSEGDSLQP